MCMYVCIYVYMCMCVCMYVCVNIVLYMYVCPPYVSRDPPISPSMHCTCSAHLRTILCTQPRCHCVTTISKTDCSFAICPVWNFVHFTGKLKQICASVSSTAVRLLTVNGFYICSRNHSENLKEWAALKFKAGAQSGGRETSRVTLLHMKRSS